MLVVGYSDVDNCWICRNSWGQGFGGAAKPEGVGAGFFKIGYGECDIDGEPFYGARGVIAPSDSRWGGWWAVAGGVAAPGTSVFGVSRSADKLDIFCVGTDHGTDTAAWQPGFTGWHGWWRVQGGVAAANSSVTAVSRSADKLDIFAVGTDYHVYTAAWEAGDTSWRGWWPVQGGVAAPGTSVFGVSAVPTSWTYSGWGLTAGFIRPHGRLGSRAGTAGGLSALSQSRPIHPSSPFRVPSITSTSSQ